MQLLFFSVGIVCLLFLSGFFSGSETAFFSLTPLDVEKMAQRKTVQRVKSLIDTPRRLLSTLLVGNMLVNVALSSIMAVLLTDVWGSRGAGAAAGLSTLLLLIFGEVTPKSFAVLHASRFARAAARPIYVISVLITPARFVLRHVSGAVLFVLGQGKLETQRKLRREELETQVDLSADEGTLAEYERKIVQNIFELAEVPAKAIMVPRTEMHCISDEMRVDEALRRAAEWRHSRIPIYRGEVDEIYAVLHLKDSVDWRKFGEECPTLRQWLEDDTAAPQGDERRLVREVLFRPESKGIGGLFREMKDTRQHMSILLDEFGGVSGLITVIDILNEIAGLDEEEEMADLGEGDRFVLPGRIAVHKLNKRFGLELDEKKADTLGGYVSALLGHFPRQGETVRENALQFTVLEMGERWVHRVELRREF